MAAGQGEAAARQAGVGMPRRGSGVHASRALRAGLAPALHPRRRGPSRRCLTRSLSFMQPEVGLYSSHSPHVFMVSDTAWQVALRLVVFWQPVRICGEEVGGARGAASVSAGPGPTSKGD